MGNSSESEVMRKSSESEVMRKDGGVKEGRRAATGIYTKKAPLRSQQVYGRMPVRLLYIIGFFPPKVSAV